MKTFNITNTFTNTTTQETHENIYQAWASHDKSLRVQAYEDIVTNGLEENWKDYYATKKEAEFGHILNFLYFRRKEYEIVEVKEGL